MKIEDFGQILPGAAKHRYHAWRLKLTHVPDQAVDDVSLSTSFPAPNYSRLIEDGLDAEVVAAIRALRDTLGVTNSGRRRQIEAREVILHRNCAAELVDGALSVADLLSRSDRWNAWTKRITLQKIIAYHMENGHSRNFWQKDAKPSDKRQTSGRKFHLYRDRSTKKIYVGVHVGQCVVRLKDFDTLEQALDAEKTQAAELLQILEEKLKIPALRNDTNRDRVGPVWREASSNISPEEFLKAFPFRGVQFGNHVENARRQLDLNDAFDAFHDFSSILDVPPAALTFDGALGLAFGARGRGGKYGGIAHFETVGRNINITKVRGAGSFAHEWWHALDNDVARLAGLDHALATDLLANRKISAARLGALGDELSLLLAAIEKTDLARRSARLDQKRPKPYFALRHEITARAFEAWVLHRLQENAQSSDWLVNLIDWSSWNETSEEGQASEIGSYPYPYPEEMAVIAAAFDHLFRRNGPMHAHLCGLGDVRTAAA